VVLVLTFVIHLSAIGQSQLTASLGISRAGAYSSSKSFEEFTSYSLDIQAARNAIGMATQPKSSLWQDLNQGQESGDLGFSLEPKTPYFQNKRNLYSSLWAFASLNYLYADIVGLMDAQMHAQYETGVVDGTEITPQFLTGAALFMQIPLANVFLPHVIKNDRALRWLQIASGTIMSLVQAGTLFMGKPSSHYVAFSTIEIATTTFITIDAIHWKPLKKKKHKRYEK
ncbi:MAG: DUF6326 family protein, partial [Schleiferiaceae bacterium]|nr:DUF6326 family protein [Schleiferiaceae bacterium]